MSLLSLRFNSYGELDIVVSKSSKMNKVQVPKVQNDGSYFQLAAIGFNPDARSFYVNLVTTDKTTGYTKIRKYYLSPGPYQTAYDRRSVTLNHVSDTPFDVYDGFTIDLN
jgi:hypothetical protein